MKKLSLVLALCAFIAAPAFANDHAAPATAAPAASTEHMNGEHAAADAAATNEMNKAPAKHGKMAKKGKKAKMHKDEAAHQ